MNKIESKNKFVVGDIHGNINALRQVLDKTPIVDGDILVFLGDYGDGFPFTSEVVDLLLELQNKYNCVFLLGNHDVWIRDWFNIGEQPLIWTEQGGNATIESYIESGKLQDEAHRQFWNNLKPYYIDEDGNLFVHGGWNGKQSFEDSKNKMMSGSSYLDILWDRSLAEGITTEHTDHFKNIFIGHTATRNHDVYNNRNIWNIDTGAGWDGRLTIMNVDTKEYWQSGKNKMSPR